MINQFAQNTFRALYRTFSECCFIEDKGDIVFYKNRKGEAARVVADIGVDCIPESVSVKESVAMI